MNRLFIDTLNQIHKDTLASEVISLHGRHEPYQGFLIYEPVLKRYFILNDCLTRSSKLPSYIRTVKNATDFIIQADIICIEGMDRGEENMRLRQAHPNPADAFTQARLAGIEFRNEMDKINSQQRNEKGGKKQTCIELENVETALRGVMKLIDEMAASFQSQNLPHLEINDHLDSKMSDIRLGLAEIEEELKP